MVSLGVVGSRQPQHRGFVRLMLKRVARSNDVRFVSGGARGIDSIASKIAVETDAELCVFLPDWTLYGKAAGFRRNKQIIDASDVVWAFWDGTSRGTAHSMKLAQNSGKELVTFYV